MAKKSEILNIDAIAKMYGLPDFDAVQEMNIEYVGEARIAAEREARQEELSEEKIEEAGFKAEEEAMDEIYRNWHHAVESAADEILGYHHLQLAPRRAGERAPYEYDIEPVRGKSWDDAAIAIAQTIEGVGLVSVATEDMRPAKKFVLSHIGATRDYPEVYGTSSASRIYERSWR